MRKCLNNNPTSILCFEPGLDSLDDGSIFRESAHVAPNTRVLIQPLDQCMEAELTLWDNEDPLPRIRMLNTVGTAACVQRFPNLALHAIQYLAIPAKSASSKRLFSSTGLTITNDRARLSKDHAANLVFLYENLPTIREWRS